MKDFALQMERPGRTGWYFCVLSSGSVQPGMKLTLVERTAPQWSIASANEIMHRRKSDAAAALALAASPGLSASWQQSLIRRAAGWASDVRTHLGES